MTVTYTLELNWSQNQLRLHFPPVHFSFILILDLGTLQSIKIKDQDKGKGSMIIDQGQR